MIFLFVLLLLVVGFFKWRATRRATLNGLNGDRPVFHVSPPDRRLGSRKGERL